MAWGNNTFGQLGDGTATCSWGPIELTGITNAIAVAAGAYHSMALASDGSVWTWGLNSSGELGNDCTEDSLVPVQVSGLSNVVAIAAGHYSSYALKSDHTLWAWGANWAGQLADGTFTDRHTPVQVVGFNLLAYDTDGDGIPDEWENQYGLDPDDPDDASLDLDEDGLSNREEYLRGTDPTNPDTDGDGLSDGDEVNTYGTCEMNPDSDGDGLSDGDEIYTYNTDPTNRDTDGDEMPDGWEIANGFDPNDPEDASPDPDGDGLSNVDEYYWGTDPYNADTDGDGMPDGWEATYWLNPTDAGDAADDPDGDGQTNWQEYQNGTDPNDYFNGVLPLVSIVSGDNQTGLTGTELPNPLVVLVTTTNGVPLTNAPVSFLVTQGNGTGFPTDSTDAWCNQYRTLVVLTDTNGEASIFFQFDMYPETNLITASVTTADQTTNVEFTAYSVDSFADAPDIAITSPSDLYLTNATSLAFTLSYFNINGTVGTVLLQLDGTQVGSVENPEGTTSGSTNLVVDLSNLSDGTNSYQALAYTGANSSGSVSTSSVVRVIIDRTAPALASSLSALPNSSGWNNTNVTVSFTAEGGSVIVPSVTLTNEGADQLVEGVAVDSAGNMSTYAVFVSIDLTPPTLTGQPADGDTINGTKPPFVIEYTDDLSGIDLSTLQVTLDGTNVTANFNALATGALWTPTNDLAAGTHTWEISVNDLAGISAIANAIFTITTNSPLHSNVNIASSIEMPDVEAMWIQGDRADSNTVVSFSVNFGQPQAFNARGNQFGRLIPIEFGTNLIMISASKEGAGKSGQALAVIRSDRYRAKLNAPTSGDCVMDGPTGGVLRQRPAAGDQRLCERVQG